jgi:hypothetical protein
MRAIQLAAVLVVASAPAPAHGQTAAATLPATPAAPQLPGLDAPASQPADGVDGEPRSPLYPAGTPYPAGVPLPSTGGLGFSNTDNSLDGQPMSGGALQ